MSQTERPRTLRQNTSGRRSRSRPSSKRRSVKRRSATDGGSILGGLVAGERARLGLTQSQLAARIHTSRSKVARIEQGQTPDAETQRRLSRALNPERGPVRRFVARVAGRMRLGVPHGSRWLWSGVVVVVALISMLVVVDGRFSSTGSGPSFRQPAIAESDALGVPSVIDRARAQAKKSLAAQIAARRAAAAIAGKPTVDEVHRGLPAVSNSVTEPISPSSGGGGGGGGSGGSGPDLTDHGVGSHGGGAPQGGAAAPAPAPAPAESGGGSTPAPRPSCVLPGILC